MKFTSGKLLHPSICYLIIWAVPFLNCMFAQCVIFLASKDPFDNTFSFHSTIFNTLEPTFGHL